LAALDGGGLLLCSLGFLITGILYDTRNAAYRFRFGFFEAPFLRLKDRFAA
jgi:hypothetical protein